MASLNTFQSNITGTTGSVNTIEPKSGWKVYILARGGYASQASSGALLTFDSSSVASRFAVNDWVQVGTAVSKIAKVTAVGGNSISLNASETVALNDRILNVGQTQPVVTSGNATYWPSVLLYTRDDDASTGTTVLTTDSNGLYRFSSADGIYDELIVDANGSNQMYVADIQVGSQPSVDLTGTVAGLNLGTCTTPFGNVVFTGKLESGITSAAGRTAFNFDTCNGITLGNLFAFGNTGSVMVYGDTFGGVFSSYSLPEVFNVKSARFGAKGDGSTDDTTAISSAIAAAIATTNLGAVVFFPPGTYIVNSTITIPSKVVLRGSGRSSTMIKCGASFSFNGSTDAIIRIGNAGVNAHGARIEDLNVDCNDVAGSIGVYSTTANELSGIINCVIQKPVITGAFFSTSACANFYVDGLEIFMSDTASSSTAKGVDLSSCTGVCRIGRVTVNNFSGSGTNMAIGIHARHTSGNLINIDNCHFEGCLIGIRCSSSGVRINACSGNASITQTLTCIDNGIGNIVITNAMAAGSALGVSDVQMGLSSSSDVIYYFSGGIASRNLITNVSSIRWNIPSPVIFGSTATVDGQFGVTGAAVFGATVTCNGPFLSGVVANYLSTQVISGATYLILSPLYKFYGVSAPTGGIAGITPLSAGREVVLLADRGTLNLTAAAGFDIDASTLTSQQRTGFWCSGTTWYESQTKAS